MRILFSIFLASLAISAAARAGVLDAVPFQDTLDLDRAGTVKINGAEVADRKAAPAELYADVTQVIQGEEGEVLLYLRPMEIRQNGVDSAPVSAEPRPFVPASDWKMYDSAGRLTDDARYAYRVVLPYTPPGDASLFEVNWNECQGSINGNYVGLPCSQHRGMSDDYLAYLKVHYLPCVDESLHAAGYASAVSVHLVHDGTTADNQHNKHSLHVVGRAIDVMQVTTTDGSGATHFFDFQKTNMDHKLSKSCKPAGTANCKFFEAFRACWHKLQVARKCPARQDGPLGTIGWEDPRHIAHHLHTSYPFCPNSKGMFITKKGQ